MARDAERRARDARGTELEATGIHIRGAVAARAVAVESADREVIARGADDGDVGEGRRHRRTVTGETPAHALVRAGDGIHRIVARGGMALGARRRGRNVVRGLGVTGLVGREDGRGGVTAVTVAGGRVELIQRRWTGVSGRGRG